MKKPTRTSWRRRRALLLVAVGVVAAGMSIAAFATHLLQGPELQVVDTHFSVRGKQTPPSDVAVVAVDAQSLQQINRTWPFPRHYEAKVIERLHAAGARAIAVDLQFTQPQDPTDDQALAQSIYNAGNVVLTTDSVNAKGQSDILGGDQVLRELHATWGISSVKPDGDGVYRRVYYSLSGVRTFAAAAASRALGRPVKRLSFPSGGSAPIDFAGTPGTIPTYSFSDVFFGRVPASAFKGRVVVVGASDPSLQDVHPTAASRVEQMPGPEIQASAISTILRGFPLKDATGAVNILLIVALALVVPIANLWVRSWRAGALALLIAIAYVIATQLAFNGGLIITFVYPLMAMLLATVGTLGADYLFKAFEHERVRDTFSRFVDDAVIEEVLAHAGDDLRFGGEQRICTVLFSDLRGFTSVSETLHAEVVIQVVNHYLDEMTEAIMGAGGTLVSYMGDGIMAVFGAPLDQPDHAERALRAAREMLDVRLPRFNTWLREQGIADKDFRMGIGLNTGTVMTGNVGSRRRVEYSAIGDTTNTASRLEGMTKGTPHMLFMSQATTELLDGQPDDLVLVGDFEIRGRQAKMRIWSIRDEGADGQPAPPGAPVMSRPDVTPAPAPSSGNGVAAGDEPVVKIL
jgi:adenylate cyclase